MDVEGFTNMNGHHHHHHHLHREIAMNMIVIIMFDAGRAAHWCKVYLGRP